MASLDNLRSKIIAQSPTEEQKEAIFTGEDEFLLRAAPGSGKTWTSCRRFIWRGANWDYEIGGLALLSFTNVAINEFKVATSEVGRSELLSDPNYVGTFDAFVERFILSPFGHLISGLDKRPKLHRSAHPSHWDNENLKAWVRSSSKWRPIYAWDIIPYPEDDKIKFKAKNYRNSIPHDQAYPAILSLMRLGYYTHAQRAFWGVVLLSQRPHIASLLARRFPEIIVDEAQDTNAWLNVLLNLIREKGSKITLVGDPDQCIYEFSMADATSLLNLKSKWGIIEKPLSQSFRCNDEIASVVKYIGGNYDFKGCGSPEKEGHKGYIFSETSEDYNNSIEKFKGLIIEKDLELLNSAIVCRAHKQLEMIRGKVNYKDLKGNTRKLAKAAFLRDSLKDYHKANEIIEEILRELTDYNSLWDLMDENPESEEVQVAKVLIWRFVKDFEKLPSVNLIGSDWVDTVKNNLEILINDLDLNPKSSLGYQIKRTGLSTEQLQLPLFEAISEFPNIRTETIHQVKGESIDAVMPVGSVRFWNSVVNAIDNDENTEDRRLAYVAMTRARHFLFVPLPENHLNKYSDLWESWGFELIQ